MRKLPSSLRVVLANGSRRAAAGFSLIEVTLALGIVTFALVGVIGVLPVAMVSSRQSIDKNRAAAIANTLYTSFRSQPFQKVSYLDSQFNRDGTPLSGASGQLDFNALKTSSGTTPTPEVKFYATFLDVSSFSGTTGDTFGSQRRLCFTGAGSGGGADYLVLMHFNNQPEGMVVTPVAGTANGTPTVPAQANQVELLISPTSRPADRYRFISIIANRTN